MTHLSRLLYLHCSQSVGRAPNLFGFTVVSAIFFDCHNHYILLSLNFKEAVCNSAFKNGTKHEQIDNQKSLNWFDVQIHFHDCKKKKKAAVTTGASIVLFFVVTDRVATPTNV